MSEETVGPGRLAEALGVSERHVYRLARMGMPKDGRGAYPLVRCARWYRVHVLSPEEDDAPDLGEARLRKARARAVEMERTLATRREGVMSADVWDDVVREQDAWIREQVRSFVPGWVEALEGVASAAQAAATLKAKVGEALAELCRRSVWIHESEEAEDERAA